MRSRSNGFSLVELLMALAITMGIGGLVFQLFRQNERVFRDQNVIIEMQQNARAVAAQIGDEIRMAGKGVPLYASRFDVAANEAVAAILPSSTSSRIDFRTGFSDVESYVTSALPIDCVLGASRSLSVGNAFSFSSAVGTTPPSGKYVYIWGPTGNSAWAWVRAELTQIAANALTITPLQASSATVRFLKAPTISLEESVSFQLSGNTIRRSTGSAANEIGRNFASLVFTYYDNENNVVTPDSLASRLSITRVDVNIAAQASESLNDGKRPIYPIFLRIIPRNLRIR